MKLALGKKSTGFTLIELMTAMAITSVLVLLLMGITSSALSFLKISREDVIASQNSRPVLSTMASDIESMHYRQGNDFEWLYAARDPGLTPTTMRLGPRTQQATNAVQLLFFSSAPDRLSPMDSMGNEISISRRRAGGDINLISYRLVYRDVVLDEDATSDTSGFPIFALYRNVVAADSTFSGGQGGGPLLGQRNLQNAYSSRERDEIDPANFIAENIIEFTLLFEIEYKSRAGDAGSGSGSDRSIKSVPILATSSGQRRSGGMGDASQFRLKGNTIQIQGGAGSTPGLESGRLSAVTVSMTVITDEGMAIIDAWRKNNNRPKEKDFFAKYTRNFTQRIPIVRP